MVAEIFAHARKAGREFRRADAERSRPALRGGCTNNLFVHLKNAVWCPMAKWQPNHSPCVVPRDLTHPTLADFYKAEAGLSRGEVKRSLPTTLPGRRLRHSGSALVPFRKLLDAQLFSRRVPGSLTCSAGVAAKGAPLADKSAKRDACANQAKAKATVEKAKKAREKEAAKAAAALAWRYREARNGQFCDTTSPQDVSQNPKDLINNARTMSAFMLIRSSRYPISKL